MAGDRPDLAEEFALWAAKAHGGASGEATSVRATLRGITDEGHALEGDWPYGSPAYPAAPPTAATDRSRRRHPGLWRQLADLTIASVRTELWAGNAVILSLNFVPVAWTGAASEGWVDAPPGAAVFNGHAVLAVGIRPPGGGRPLSVICKNSWGPRWGDAGYGYISEQYLTRYGKRAFALARRLP